MVHGECADNTENLEEITERVRREFNGEIIQRNGLGFGLKTYIQQEAAKMTERGYDPIRDGLAESWHDKEHPPEVGDVLIGEVLSVDIGRNGFGRYPILTVVAEEGSSKVGAGDSVAFHGFTSVAMSQLNKARPRVGERVRIECTNVPQERGVRGDYWGWSVRVDRQLGEADWDNVFGVTEDYVQGGEQQAGFNRADKTSAPEPEKPVVSEEPPF